MRRNNQSQRGLDREIAALVQKRTDRMGAVLGEFRQRGLSAEDAAAAFGSSCFGGDPRMIAEALAAKMARPRGRLQ